MRTGYLKEKEKTDMMHPPTWELKVHFVDLGYWILFRLLSDDVVVGIIVGFCFHSCIYIILKR